jgi:hypothetical protein
VTAGAGDAFLYERDGLKTSFSIPALACVNPIGAGDTCSAVMLYRCVCMCTGEEGVDGRRACSAIGVWGNPLIINSTNDVAPFRLCHGTEAPDAFHWGLAAASASCLHMQVCPEANLIQESKLNRL